MKETGISEGEVVGGNDQEVKEVSVEEMTTKEEEDGMGEEKIGAASVGTESADPGVPSNVRRSSRIQGRKAGANIDQFLQGLNLN